VEPPVALLSACSECICRFNELLNIHSAIDPFDRLIQPTDPESMYRLWKAHLHVRAITVWTIDTDAMHVIAPEIRAALDQVDRVWEDAAHDLELDDIAMEEGTRAGRLRAKANRETTSAFVHPSPTRLLLPQESGGLLSGDEGRCYGVLLDLLSHLAFRYAISLTYLSRRLGNPQESSIASVTEKLTAVLASAMRPSSGDRSGPC